MPRLSSLLFSLLSIAIPASAGIDSGGGMSQVGVLRNHCSIGGAVVSQVSQIGNLVNRLGILEVIYFQVTLAAVQYDPNVDSDHDGNSDFMEHLAGTDPANAASVFRPRGYFSNGVFRMPIPTITERNYHIFASTDLKNWVLFRTLVGNGDIRVFEFDQNSIAAGQALGGIRPDRCFFRIQITAPESDILLDTDHDGVSDQMEYLAGTLPDDSSSVFRPRGSYSGGVFRMPLPTLQGRSYQILVSKDLRNWHLFSTLSGNDSVQVFEFDESQIMSGPLYTSSGPSSYFFKVQIVMP